MTSADEVVFLFDVDNTLLDNDRVQEDLRSHLERGFGAATRDRYWAIFEALRAELGYTDYLGALQRYRLEDLCDPRLLRMSSFLARDITRLIPKPSPPTRRLTSPSSVSAICATMIYPSYSATQKPTAHTRRYHESDPTTA